MEEPNQRRGGESGVQRLSDAKGKVLYAKRQVGHIYRSLRHPFGRPTVLRELDALNSFEQLGVRVPRLVFAGAERGADHQWRALLVSEALDGFVDLDTWHAEGARERYPQVLHERMLKELADNLARMHLGHWQHGCLYGKHVFVKVIGEGEGPGRSRAAGPEKCRRRISCQRAAVRTCANCGAIRHSTMHSGRACSIFTRWRLAALSKG